MNRPRKSYSINDLQAEIETAQRKANAGDERSRRRLPGLRKRLSDVLAERDQTQEFPLDTSTLTAWERYQLASHKHRPLALDYIENLCTEFLELHGDRQFGNDRAVVCGTARFRGRPVAVIGQQKGRDIPERLMRNFGMMHPEGYRKALRVMELGARFRMPLLIFIDTKGAFPGVGAEERGQAEAIARNIRDMFGLRVPIVVAIIGEGASGGALGIGVGDRVLMMENAWYNVISPEGCAAILWNDPQMAPRAAEALKLSAKDVFELRVVDEIVPEPGGGAHREPQMAYDELGRAIERNLTELLALGTDKMMAARFEKFRTMGVFTTT